MSVDDRDVFEEAVTTETRAYWANEAPAEEKSNRDDFPAFLAMGTESGVLREEDLEVTQPIPLQTMAELVFAPAPAPEVKHRIARGTTVPVVGQEHRPGTSSSIAEMAGDGDGGLDAVDRALAKGTQAMPALRLSPSFASLSELSQVSASGEEDPGFEQVDMPLAVPGSSRKVRPRRSRPRARTIAARRLTNVELRQVEDTLVEQADRPRTRAECAHEQRPCPWVSCKHHLYLDVNPRTGSIKLNFPDLEPWELQHTCALDVADDGGHTLEEVGDITNLTRERIRQLEMRGLIELRGRSRSLR